MLSIVVGLLFLLSGLWGIWNWTSDFLLVLRGAVPPMFVLGGILAIVAGASSLRGESDSSPGRSTPPSSNSEK